MPCRLGSQRALHLAQAGLRPENEARLRTTLHVMQQASLCAFGQLTPGPVLQLLERFGADLAGR